MARLLLFVNVPSILSIVPALLTILDPIKSPTILLIVPPPLIPLRLFISELIKEPTILVITP
jgi:hypothetical protein